MGQMGAEMIFDTLIAGEPVGDPAEGLSDDLCTACN